MSASSTLTCCITQTIKLHPVTAVLNTTKHLGLLMLQTTYNHDLRHEKFGSFLVWCKSLSVSPGWFQDVAGYDGHSALSRLWAEGYISA